MNIFIFHGAYGNPDENWIPWLKQELEKKGNRVIVPSFPTPDNQTLENWFKILEKNVEVIPGSIIIGHSVGAAFSLHVTEKYKVKSAFLIAGFSKKLGNDFDLVNESFIKKFNWLKIKENCSKIYVVYSDNDPYVKREISEGLAKKLDVDGIMVKNAGHFNEKAGYLKFELLLDKIIKEIKNQTD